MSPHSEEWLFEMTKVWILATLCIVFSGVVTGGGSGKGICERLNDQMSSVLITSGACRDNATKTLVVKLEEKAKHDYGKPENQYPLCDDITPCKLVQ
uniref:Uncharacterized protein n=1 Tax=Trichobilharzia regenti TaxID=157069 RepID=A0AA85IT78_TRIRE|nr:unnamed protein product [Trichobilharzia regenti]